MKLKNNNIISGSVRYCDGTRADSFSCGLDGEIIHKPMLLWYQCWEYKFVESQGLTMRLATHVTQNPLHTIETAFMSVTINCANRAHSHGCAAPGRKMHGWCRSAAWDSLWMHHMECCDDNVEQKWTAFGWAWVDRNVRLATPAQDGNYKSKHLHVRCNRRRQIKKSHLVPSHAKNLIQRAATKHRDKERSVQWSFAVMPMLQKWTDPHDREQHVHDGVWLFLMRGQATKTSTVLHRAHKTVDCCASTSGAKTKH